MRHITRDYQLTQRAGRQSTGKQKLACDFQVKCSSQTETTLATCVMIEQTEPIINAYIPPSATNIKSANTRSSRLCGRASP